MRTPLLAHIWLAPPHFSNHTTDRTCQLVTGAPEPTMREPRWISGAMAGDPSELFVHGEPVLPQASLGKCSLVPHSFISRLFLLRPGPVIGATSDASQA